MPITPETYDRIIDVIGIASVIFPIVVMITAIAYHFYSLNQQVKILRELSRKISGLNSSLRHMRWF